MKLSSFFVLLIFGLLVLPSTSNAGVFEHDWQTPGDGLLTFDDISQREWLDIPWSLAEVFISN